jgi:hypothetical protein
VNAVRNNVAQLCSPLWQGFKQKQIFFFRIFRKLVLVGKIFRCTVQILFVLIYRGFRYQSKHLSFNRGVAAHARSWVGNTSTIFIAYELYNLYHWIEFSYHIFHPYRPNSLLWSRTLDSCLYNVHHHMKIDSHHMLQNFKGYNKTRMVLFCSLDFVADPELCVFLKQIIIITH